MRFVVWCQFLNRCFDISGARKSVTSRRRRTARSRSTATRVRSRSRPTELTLTSRYEEILHKNCCFFESAVPRSTTKSGKHLFQAHPSYFGQLCGACSNYNSEPMDDLMGPRKEMYTRPEEFLLSYIIPNSRCNIDEVRAKLVSRIPRLFAARDSSKYIRWTGYLCLQFYACEGHVCEHRTRISCQKLRNAFIAFPGSCQKIQQHRYETRQRDGESQACFSVRPVPTCAGDCSQQQGKERSTPVGFFCLRASDRKVPELLNKMKEGQELTEVKGKKPHFTKEVKIADQCRPRSGNDVRDRDQNKQDRDQNKQDRDQNKQDRDQYKQDRDQQQERQYIQEA